MSIQELDRIMNAAMINLYTLGKANKKICFYNFNRKDERHLACLHIADLEGQLFSYKFKIKTGILDYALIRWKTKYKWLKRDTKPSKEYALVDVEDFIAHIERANELPNAFAKLYTEYFKRYDR